MTKRDEEFEALKARVAELEKANAPPKPFKSDWVPPPNPIDYCSMSPETMKAMTDATPDWLMADIRSDRAPKSQPSLGGVGAVDEDRAPVVASRHDKGR